MSSLLKMPNHSSYSITLFGIPLILRKFDCFGNLIDLTCILFRRPTFSCLVTRVSHLCHQSVFFTVLQYFSPVFPEKLFLKENFSLINGHFTLWQVSRGGNSSHNRSDKMVTPVGSTTSYGVASPSSLLFTPVFIYSS